MIASHFGSPWDLMSDQVIVRGNTSEIQKSDSEKTQAFENLENH